MIEMSHYWAKIIKIKDLDSLDINDFLSFIFFNEI